MFYRDPEGPACANRRLPGWREEDRRGRSRLIETPHKIAGRNHLRAGKEKLLVARLLREAVDDAVEVAETAVDEAHPHSDVFPNDAVEADFFVKVGDEAHFEIEEARNLFLAAESINKENILAQRRGDL